MKVEDAHPTVRDVAELAGVSPGTVSKALNGRGQLRDTTRQRVIQAAHQLGFQPNYLARSLIEGRTYTVGVLTTDSFGRFTIPVMMGVEDSLGAGQVSTLLCDSRGDPLREKHYVEQLLKRRVDGLVVTGRRRDPRPSLGKLPIPVVYVLGESDNPHDLSMCYDDVQGTRLATTHLLDIGRKRIAYVSGPVRHVSSTLRRLGVEEALEAVGEHLDPKLALLGEWSEAWGRAAAAILARMEGVDGVVCGSDQVARGVADGFREAGVRVPDDIALVGFDNWDVMAEGCRPPLTTIDPKLTRLGRLAANHLLDGINGKPVPEGMLLTACDLVLRASTLSA